MKINNIFKNSKRSYGAIRIPKELDDEQSHGSIKTISDSMCKQNLVAKDARKFKTTDSDHALPIADNLLDRDFSVGAPNQKWV
ncbi:IS3 family transposase [Shewanella surugensis]|uniref:IS3 family transposase n=1 Tax=Shewanella surugensis TaxID=212020 RepID=A0ABT0LB99_9GAMM|nr:IS3 family transposase [Shewanella surugensis]MCL1124981.1 IS3 family transposase [Shewanella surugensis]